MINTNTRPKRKHEFIIIETGQQVYLDRIQNANIYFVCDSPALSLDDNYFPIDVSLLKEATQKRTGISAKPKALTEANKSFKKELNIFFASQLLECPDKCEECEASFYGYTQEQLRGLIAHILPKNEKHGFPDVAIHPLNRMFLGTKCGHHARWDNLGAKERKEMKVYKVAIERFNQFKSLLSEADLIRANKYLNL